MTRRMVTRGAVYGFTSPRGLRFIEGNGGDSGAAGAGVGEPAGGAGGEPAGPQGEAGAGDGGANGVTDKGFPENTAVADMKPEEQAAYWKFQSRKHQQRAESRGDYDELKAKAERLAELERASESEHEKALREAREAAKAEGRTEAQAEANRTVVTALMDGALRGRGKTDEQVESLLKHFNPESFVVDGQPDTKAILSLADSIAGPVTGGGNGRGPDFGQGQRGQHGKASGVSAGAEMFAASRGTKK